VNILPQDGLSSNVYRFRGLRKRDSVFKYLFST